MTLICPNYSARCGFQEDVGFSQELLLGGKGPNSADSSVGKVVRCVVHYVRLRHKAWNRVDRVIKPDAVGARASQIDSAVEFSVDGLTPPCRSIRQRRNLASIWKSGGCK